jgi:glycosyltransferase involved in cell wall biosynthesis
MAPTVSVIIAAYEHAPFVGAAIESVLSQSWHDLELLITDDASSDATVEVIREFSDVRLSLDVFDRNRGASAAINAALRRAQGEFVCFLGSDDRFLPGKIELQVGFMRANPGIAALFGLPKFIDADGEPIGPAEGAWYDVFKRPLQEQLRSRQEWLRRFFLRGNCLCQPTSMVRRHVLTEVGNYDARLVNLPDFDLWVRICSRYEIHLSDQEVTAMRILEGSRYNISAPQPETRRRAAIEFFHVLKRYRDFPPELVREIFAGEIAAADELASEPDHRILLAELAKTVSHPSHQLFALDTLFEAAASRDDCYRRLFSWGASADPFGIAARQEFVRLRRELASAEAEMAGLTRELAAARAAPGEPPGGPS